MRNTYPQAEADALRQELAALASVVEATTEAIKGRCREMDEYYASLQHDAAH